MEASVQPDPSLGPLALGGVNPRDLVDDGRGLTVLALMVGTVLERLTTVDEADSRQ
jgi:hypothetical protein